MSAVRGPADTYMRQLLAAAADYTVAHQDDPRRISADLMHAFYAGAAFRQAYDAPELERLRALAGLLESGR